MPSYRVRWEIDVDADTPAEAACTARRLAVHEDTTATIFDVSRQISDCGGIDDGPVFELVQSFDVVSAPSHPHYRADHQCTACTEFFNASQIISVGSNETARSLGVKIGDEVCTGCAGE